MYIEKKRCTWADLSKEDYLKYHDTEWGVPLFDDIKLFEFLTLESHQAGLSWYLILKKRNNYRIAFDNFDPIKIASYDEKKINGLLNNEGIIRNKLKITATINNAQKFLEIQHKYGTFSKYIWDFVNGYPILNKIEKKINAPANSRESDKLSKDLKIRGFKFLGSTVCYSHMQATGMVNDHCIECYRREEIINMYKSIF